MLRKVAHIASAVLGVQLLLLYGLSLWLSADGSVWPGTWKDKYQGGPLPLSIHLTLVNGVAVANISSHVPVGTPGAPAGKVQGAGASWRGFTLRVNGYSFTPPIGGRAAVVRKYHLVSTPLWAPAVLLLLPALVAFVRGPVRRSVRRRRGRCLSCGYPLIGLPEPRCPECGTAFGEVGLEREDSLAPHREAGSRG